MRVITTTATMQTRRSRGNAGPSRSAVNAASGFSARRRAEAGNRETPTSTASRPSLERQQELRSGRRGVRRPRPVNGGQPDAPKQDERAFVWGWGKKKSARLVVRQCGKKPLCARGAVSAGETIQAVVITQNGAIVLNRGGSGTQAPPAESLPAPKIFLQKRLSHKGYPLYGQDHFWTGFCQRGHKQFSESKSPPYRGVVSAACASKLV
jgi:hypothetical protein